MTTKFARLWLVALTGAAIFTLAASAAAQDGAATHVVPFFPAVSDTHPQGLVRIVNLSGEAGTLEIVAIGADGVRVDGVSLAIDAGETAHFDSDDLESGNPDAGLTGATGPGQGDWRLELTSDLHIEVQAYMRTGDGVLAEMYETAAGAGDRFRIATFNPGSNVNQVGLLWLFNRGDEPVAVTVQGTDDLGQSPGPGVSIDLPAREARTYTAAELESGAAPGLSGSLGDGAGKWRLDGEASGQVLAMSLISSPTGHLTNLSTLPSSVSDGVHRVPLFPPASDALGRQGFARVINRSDADGEVRIEAFDGTDWSYEALTLPLEAGETQQFNSTDLELGNPAKGLTGSTGAGDGDWRLELRSELDLEVLSYVRTVGGQGYVTPMHDTAVQESDGLKRYYVPIFHRAEYEAQESRLHLFNVGEAEARVGIAGLDDVGAAAPEGDVSLVLQPGGTRVVTAAELESGGDGMDGRLGKGEGRWRLYVSSGEALQVMSLGYSKDGFLANLSRGSPPAFAASVAAPDLVVEGPSVSDDALEAGHSFTLRATVRNRGNGDAESTTLRYYRSANASISASDTEVGMDHVRALDASGSSGERIVRSAPSNAGTYFYGACVDSVAGESDTANNCSRAVTVTVRAASVADPPPAERPSHPDLSVSASADNDTPAPGGAFTLSATVTNMGAGPAAATTLRYYRSTDTTITTSDRAEGTDGVATLADSGTSAESISLNAQITPGRYYYGACVDAVPGEINSANNCSAAVTVTVTVTVPDQESVARPDLEARHREYDWEENSCRRDRRSISFAVYNIGKARAGESTFRFYISDDATISPSDEELHSVWIPAVEPGDDLAYNGYTIEQGPGTRYYGACFDPVDGETNTSNNCTEALAVWVGVPDLEAEVSSCGTNCIRTTVRNVGTGCAGRSSWCVYCSSDPAATLKSAIQGMGRDTFPIGAGVETSQTWSFLDSACSSGPYYFLYVRPVSGEINTRNNVSPKVRIE